MFKSNEEKINRIEELLNRRNIANRELEIMEDFLKRAASELISSISVSYGTHGGDMLPPMCADGFISSVKADVDRTRLELMAIEKELNDILNSALCS